MARSKKCLSCVYCRQLRSDGTAKRDWKNNYTCDFLLITGERKDKGKDVNNCKLYKENKKRVDNVILRV